MPIDALSVLGAQLTRDLLAIAKFLFFLLNLSNHRYGGQCHNLLVSNLEKKNVGYQKLLNPFYKGRRS